MWAISRQVFFEHFTSFGFSCHFVETFDELFTLPRSPIVAVTELDESVEEAKSRLREINARFKIAVCRLRSPNEVRTEVGIDAIISRHIKRDSLRNIIEQLLKTGSAVQ